MPGYNPVPAHTLERWSAIGALVSAPAIRHMLPQDECDAGDHSFHQRLGPPRAPQIQIHGDNTDQRGTEGGQQYRHDEEARRVSPIGFRPAKRVAIIGPESRRRTACAAEQITRDNRNAQCGRKNEGAAASDKLRCATRQEPACPSRTTVPSAGCDVPMASSSPRQDFPGDRVNIDAVPRLLKSSWQPHRGLPGLSIPQPAPGTCTAARRKWLQSIAWASRVPLLREIGAESSCASRF